MNAEPKPLTPAPSSEAMDLLAREQDYTDRDNSLHDDGSYPTFTRRDDEDDATLSDDEACLYPIEFSKHRPLTDKLHKGECALCKMTKVSRFFEGLVFTEKTYCEPCHYREARMLHRMASRCVPLR